MTKLIRQMKLKFEISKQLSRIIGYNFLGFQVVIVQVMVMGVVIPCNLEAHTNVTIIRVEVFFH
jgi:hypothetical protein